MQMEGGLVTEKDIKIYVNYLQPVMDWFYFISEATEELKLQFRIMLKKFNTKILD